MTESLINSISKHVELNSDEENLIKTFWSNKSLDKGDYILRNGETCRTDNFVVKGALKAYIINTESGKEEVLYFAIENWWATDIESFRTQKPSAYNIQAIESTEILQIRYDAFQDMLHQIPKLERFFRIILEGYVGSLQRRLIINNVMDAEKRYFDFIATYPKIAERVPNYLIASYLGITAEFLSRIRTKKQ
ncbi:Crp/Fnr family transcriptional regulator [Muricauda sp. 2012CJ35-5]|uniref:Crp/Fnr family transcriptional regulator n=1 Tax=Flagellimonas spongiicola TaxID=2942208 RepID=A0ABT0PUH6_9FLAO|nr:Crp/Fnr family transcriptional regulator [Allomuricauda spongiicola]MCL6274936.1 Crp/Fnr family transcriptional regulator [Allomuricauda spongiicola]